MILARHSVRGYLLRLERATRRPQGPRISDFSKLERVQFASQPHTIIVPNVHLRRAQSDVWRVPRPREYYTSPDTEHGRTYV